MAACKAREPDPARAQTYTTNVRRPPDPTSRLLVDADGRNRLGGAVPSPASAFLLALITLPTLFWLVTLKRTTDYTRPEQWLMNDVVPQVRRVGRSTLPSSHALLLGISGLGSGWFVAAGFAVLGLIALAKGRQDLALVLAAGVLAFPIEWALKYFVAIPPITLPELVAAIFNVNGIGLDDVADFPAGHALRAVAFYGLAAFCVARLAPDRRGIHRLRGGGGPDRCHQPDPRLPRRALPDRRARRLDGGRRTGLGDRGGLRAGRG